MCGNSLLEEFEGIKLFDESLLTEETKDIRPELDKIDEEIKQLHLKAGEISLGKTDGSIEEIKKTIKKLERKRKKLTTKPEDESIDVTLTNFDQIQRDEAKIKLKNLKAKQKEFFNSFDRDSKKALREEIENIEWELIEATLKQQGNEEALEKLNKIRKSKSKPFFLWKLYFADVFQRENPGFDVVIGNPPYGAEISRENLNYIKNKIKDTNNLNSAALFIDYAKNQWIRHNGTLSYIVPKSLLYSERWFSLVLSMIEKVSILVDVEKAFEKVKLEQVVFVYNNKINSDSYLARKFLEDEFKFSTTIKNETAMKLKAWVCGVKEEEINLIQNIKKELIYLNSISITKRGVGIQKFLQKEGKYCVIGGKNIFRFGIAGYKGFVSDDVFKKNKRKMEFLKQPKIISQDLVAHIQNPKPHIKIISHIDEKGLYIDLDTVQNTIIIDKSFEHKFILALLNSRFVSWYVYKFIYCSAIRTMHLDSYYMGKIIVPKNPEQKPFIKQAKVKQLEKEIDQLVYKLYELTPEEVSIVEESLN
jgi:hypothetical protein